MAATVLLITPPFTQLNTPYPATAYLKGFLNTKNISAFQADLGLDTTLAIFSATGLTHLFAQIQTDHLPQYSANSQRIYALKQQYIHSIDAVIAFLQGQQPTLAHRIASRNWLPEAARFEQLADLQLSFGTMGITEKAKHLATMYLEDLADFIQECIDPHFGFSRYAEQLGRSANSFTELYAALQQPPTFTDTVMLQQLHQLIATVQPQLIALSVPFPGNLYTSLRCSQYVRQHFPSIKIAMGGGFANTELRQLSDPRVFEFYHFITLDDGEAPIENLVHHVAGSLPQAQLKRTFCLNPQGEVQYINNTSCTDYPQAQTGTPDYSDLHLNQYISAIEIINPMHSLWSDGRWNKLTMAHGCYWGKCTFCDVSLPYIEHYEPLTAELICNRMETLIAQTGMNGFHFVDEAAPPALMRAVALEIIKRNLNVSWWTNVRFEKSFTRDLCLLLKASGCIGVSGGLEVASDRLLALINKGITVAQVAQVTQHFTQAGIMVHAYLMYGYPTQTEQETIDSLEMVRQLFQLRILQSAFWHRFALTVHSPVGLHPHDYQIEKQSAVGSFANNDALYTEINNNTQHDDFSFGLKKSLHNYMHGHCLDMPLKEWFTFKVPKTTIAPNYIEQCLQALPAPLKPTTKVVWLGTMPEYSEQTKSKKGAQWTVAVLNFYTLSGSLQIKLSPPEAQWLLQLLPQLQLTPTTSALTTLGSIQQGYLHAGFTDFELFWDNKPINQLYKAGLLHL